MLLYHVSYAAAYNVQYTSSSQRKPKSKNARLSLLKMNLLQRTIGFPVMLNTSILFDYCAMRTKASYLN